MIFLSVFDGYRKRRFARLLYDFNLDSETSLDRLRGHGNGGRILYQYRSIVQVPIILTFEIGTEWI